MQLLHGLDGLLKSPKRSVMSVGNFDGVHLGHQRIFKTAREIAAERKAELVFVTFEPHPLTVLRPQAVPPRLTTPQIKQELLEAQGANYLVILPPEKQVLDLSAEDFWTILHERVAVSDLVEGASFRFGRGARGSVKMLADWSSQTDLKLHVVDSVQVPLLDLQITPVSSSVIRFLLAYGRVRDAAICLGRPYVLSGPVQKGFSRGKSLGTPTANLLCDGQLIPADGVYAGRCTLDKKQYPAAVSIGTMPTFGDNARQIEAHLIGFDGDLYGKTISVELLDWLRDQRTYPGVEPLKVQISKDITETIAAAGRNFVRPIASVTGHTLSGPISNPGGFA
jgi:riboflavin kinase / FMN adenylyltransferase